MYLSDEKKKKKKDSKKCLDHYLDLEFEGLYRKLVSYSRYLDFPYETFCQFGSDSRINSRPNLIGLLSSLDQNSDPNTFRAHRCRSKPELSSNFIEADRKDLTGNYESTYQS